MLTDRRVMEVWDGAKGRLGRKGKREEGGRMREGGRRREGREEEQREEGKEGRRPTVRLCKDQY